MFRLFMVHLNHGVVRKRIISDFITFQIYRHPVRKMNMLWMCQLFPSKLHHNMLFHSVLTVKSSQCALHIFIRSTHFSHYLVFHFSLFPIQFQFYYTYMWKKIVWPRPLHRFVRLFSTLNHTNNSTIGYNLFNTSNYDIPYYWN